MGNRTLAPALAAGIALTTAALTTALPDATAQEAEGAGHRPAVLVGAGDIATCSSSGDEATAKLLASVDGTVFTLGDNVYPSGQAKDFTACYDGSWGRQRSRTRPALGNHDYLTAGAAGYFSYFGTPADARLAEAGAAGASTDTTTLYAGTGYYSYDLGPWHVVVLNSNCAQVGGCEAGSAQERWLRADLHSSSSRACTLAYWHHPLFSSGAEHGPSPVVRPLFQALYDNGAEIVMSGHEHNYERFAPQTPQGTPDDARGIRQFVVGTGGAEASGFGRTTANSQVRRSGTFGVLQLTLADDSYTWRFLPVAGSSFSDTGSGTCH